MQFEFRIRLAVIYDCPQLVWLTNVSNFIAKSADIQEKDSTNPLKFPNFSYSTDNRRVTKVMEFKGFV